MKEYTSPASHTAEHVLNQTMVRMFNRGRSFSSHIEKKKSKCDYRFDRDLTQEEVLEIERRVNEVLQSDLDITEEFLSREEATNQYNLGRLPDSVGNSIRIIRIGDYDACPCSGQHVASTSNVGRFRIVSTSYDSGVLRLRFKIEQPPS